MKINLELYPNLACGSLIPRDIEVWLPEEYNSKPDRKFPVIYMHDGQNLFRKNNFIRHTWKIAENITKLAKTKKITAAIVVGIGNTPNRVGDYIPAKPFSTNESLKFIKEFQQNFNLNEFEIVSDEYLKLIVDQIKPLIDINYRTLPDRVNTIITGSSMGGLISLYALTEYPDIFGNAACLSTHWPICGNYIFPYLLEKLPPAGNHKIYFDHGTCGLDETYGPYQEIMDKLMCSKGYQRGIDWETKIYTGAWHNEYVWANRVKVPLSFFLGNDSQ